MEEEFSTTTIITTIIILVEVEVECLLEIITVEVISEVTAIIITNFRIDSIAIIIKDGEMRDKTVKILTTMIIIIIIIMINNQDKIPSNMVDGEDLIIFRGTRGLIHYNF